MVAFADTQLAFIVLLAGPALPGTEVLYQQNEAVYRAMGASDSAVAFNGRLQRELFGVMLDKDTANTTSRLMEIALRALDTAPEAYVKELGYSEQMFEMQLPALNSSWFRFFLKHDPGPMLRQVDCPILALFGGRDLQVVAGPNAAEMELVIARSRGFNEVKVFPEMNHLFQRAVTGAPDEYARIPETINEQVLAYMVEWMTKVHPPRRDD
jgi:fermentation-respiration switch protein FrsA (DUF1100 family)